MTITRRLVILLAVPLAALLAVAVLVRIQLAKIEAKSRFVAEEQIPSLAVLGNISRSFSEMRVNIRSHVLAANPADQARARSLFEEDEADVARLLDEYADKLISDDRDRRLHSDYRELSRQWTAGAKQVMVLSADGRRPEATALLNGTVINIAIRLSATSREWIDHNQKLAADAGKTAVEGIEGARREMFLTNCAVILAAAVLGFLTVRRIVRPIRSLESSVQSIAAGDYARQVPFTDATDETGSLARSIDVLKNGAAAMDDQRWVKSSAAQITGGLQGATSLAEFGQRFLSGLMPLLGGGVAGFYMPEENSARLRRIADYGLGRGDAAADSFEPGEGLVGQCARERKPQTLSELPQNYLRIGSGLGGAAPVQTVAWPLLTRETLLAVLEVATFSLFSAREKSLLDEVLPVAALSLEVLHRNLRTEQLLAQTQEQARRLEEQTEELLVQQEELTTQREQLVATEQFFRGVLELAPDGMMVVDSDGKIRLANAQCEALFGYSCDELIGQPVEMLVPEDVRPRHPALREGFHHSPSVREMGAGGLLQGRRKDGSRFAVEIGLSPLRAREGELPQVAVSIRDITERRRMEAEVRQAMHKAEEATKAKSAFLANMSHEIRTPMNGIMGMTELALDTDLTAEQRDYLNTVKSSAEALLSLLNDILDFSKIEAGRIELDPIDFALRDSITDTLNPLALRASSKGLELASDVDPAVPDALVGDVYRLRQILVNLVGNAIKFTERGEVIVSVGLAERTGDDVLLEVRVRDTGIGIKPEAAERLFKPFEQAEASTTRKYGGTGLGLAISQQLVALMGGQIRLESELGVGSTFIFTVKLKAGTPRTSSDADAAKLLQGKTALIVDDNETNRRILTTMLGHWGLRTLAADSGGAALATLDRTSNAGQPVSLVVTDLHMPEMDGFQLIEILRSRGTAVPVLLLTSSASPGDNARCAELHVAARLLKPVKQSLLLDNVIRVLAGTARSDAPPAVRPSAPAADATTQRPLNVLLAEDNPVNQKFAVRVLSGAGHQVTVANNGREALDLSGARPFDLILMDVQMPEMDGLDATRAIRAREAGSNGRTPIIAMTANAMKGDREMCFEAGMDGYVPKPVKKEVLFAEIDRILKGTTHGAAV